jgi:hypothetical protein
MHALVKGAARASGLCHRLSIFDAAWETIYRVLRSPEGARPRAIGNPAGPTQLREEIILSARSSSLGRLDRSHVPDHGQPGSYRSPVELVSINALVLTNPISSRLVGSPKLTGLWKGSRHSN